jgi:hypothetical protein
MCLSGSACCLSIAGRNPCSLRFPELLFALSISKLCQSRLISFVEISISLRKICAGLRIHGCLRLRVTVRDEHKKRKQ